MNSECKDSISLKEIINPRVIFVEGNDELNFFYHLISG